MSEELVDVSGDTVWVRDLVEHRVLVVRDRATGIKPDAAVPKHVLEEATLHCFHSLYLIQWYLSLVIDTVERFNDPDDALVGDDDVLHCFSEDAMEEPVVCTIEEDEAGVEEGDREPGGGNGSNS